MSNNNPQNSDVLEIDLHIGYQWAGDYFYIRIKHNVTGRRLVAYMNADEMIRMANDMIRAANQYKKDPQRYRDMMRFMDEARKRGDGGGGGSN